MATYRNNKGIIAPRWKALFGAALLVLFGAQAVRAAADPVQLDLTQYRGKVVYVDFWASWCGPCKQSFPFMKALRARYPADELVVLTVNVDRSRPQANSFLAKVGTGLPVIFDAQGDLAAKYKVSDMPTSLLVDRSGKIRYRHEGFFPAKQNEYQAHVAELVKEH